MIERSGEGFHRGSLFALWGTDEPDEPLQAGGLPRGEGVAEREAAGTAQPVIHAVMAFDHSIPSLEDIKAFLVNKLLCHKRFRKRIHLKGHYTHPTWATTKVDVAQHVRLVVLSPPADGSDILADGTELHNHVSQMLREELPYNRPPWEVHLISYKGRPGGALLWRIHHSIGDGISLASLLLSLADGGPAPLPGEGEKATLGGTSLLSNSASMLSRLLEVAWNTVGSLLYTLYIFLVPDLPSAIRAEGALYRKKCRRKLAVSQEVPVSEVKAIGWKAGATVNDVLMAAMSYAIARYEFEERPSSCLERHRLSFLMVVNIRPIRGIQADIAASAAGRDTHWGNRVGPISGPLPLFDERGGLLSASERLKRMHRLLKSKKSSLEPVVLSLVVRSLSCILGPWAAMAVVDRLGYNGTTLLSNVPGPQEPVILAGHQITSICNVVNGTPQASQFSFLSYDGGLRLAMTTSEAVIPEPSRLTSLFLEGIDELRDTYGVKAFLSVKHPPVTGKPTS